MRGTDRRQFFRATIPAGGYKAFLEWGEGEHFELRIVEESASGFTALATKPFTVEPKDPVFLRFNERLAEVRLVRVQKNGMGVRLGLELIRDVEQSKKKQWTKRALMVAAVAAAV